MKYRSERHKPSHPGLKKKWRLKHNQATKSSPWLVSRKKRRGKRRRRRRRSDVGYFFPCCFCLSSPCGWPLWGWELIWWVGSNCVISYSSWYLWQQENSMFILFSARYSLWASSSYWSKINNLFIFYEARNSHKSFYFKVWTCFPN